MKPKLMMILLLMGLLSAAAFSPYENRLMSGETTHVALMAAAEEGKAAELETALKSLTEKKAVKAFGKADISNIGIFSKELQGKHWFMVYFDYDGENYLKAVNAFESTGAARKLAPLLEPHPRAARYGNGWLQLEWMNFIRASQKAGKAADRLAMVTRIKPEKEQEYRTLHQTVWPGVVDQMARGNYRDFSIFFMELGNELYEFFYVEYVGADAGKDAEMNKADPFNQRWWKITDACQDPLPDAKGVWSAMNRVSE
jgi:L-rhamnose mutarotase